MEKNNTLSTAPTTKRSSLEQKALFILLTLFIAVIAGSWMYAMNLRQAIAAKNSVMTADQRALVEVERIRHVGESQMDHALSFFLLGSTTLFDEQKQDQKNLNQALNAFAQQHDLPGVAEKLKQISNIQAQQQDFFDQAMDYRAKKTESKIVGQFYRSKTNPLKIQLNVIADDLAELHKAEFEKAKAEAAATAREAEIQVPRGMTWLTGLLGFLFLGMCFLVIRMMKERGRGLAERQRLFTEAQVAVHSRDEVVSAIAQDLNEPLKEIADAVRATSGAEHLTSAVELMEDRIQDILDQTRAGSKNLVLHVDQRGLEGVLDEARMLMQPIAKQKDIRLEFSPVNPPVLAFLDHERIMRVLSNLIGNAIKFSPRQSKIIVKVRSDQQFVFVSIKDEGPGISEKNRSELMTQFWQAGKTSDQGAGIGLAVVKTIIEAHGGTVTVESHVGHGSTFSFSLPRRRPVGLQVGKPAAPVVRTSARPIPQEFREETSL